MHYVAVSMREYGAQYIKASDKTHAYAPRRRLPRGVIHGFVRSRSPRRVLDRQLSDWNRGDSRLNNSCRDRLRFGIGKRIPDLDGVRIGKRLVRVWIGQRLVSAPIGKRLDRAGVHIRNMAWFLIRRRILYMRLFVCVCVYVCMYDCM